MSGRHARNADRRRSDCEGPLSGEVSSAGPSSHGSGTLLQVVADDLVQLYQASAAHLQPPGEPFMKLRPVRFR